MAQWVDFASNGYRRFEKDELKIKFMEVPEGVIYRFEDEVEVASGKGGTVSVVSLSYVFAPVVRRDGDGK